MALWTASHLEALSSPSAYPEDPSAAAGVSWIQTHLSHVFLTRARVYKFRKDVDLGFVDFTSREARNRDCVREIELNRRLAADVYLGAAPLVVESDGVQLGSITDSIDLASNAEHAVVMRRLPDGGDALSRLERGDLTVEQIDRLVRRIVAFHRDQGLGTPAPFSPEAWIVHCRQPVDDCIESLMGSAGELREGALRFRSLFDAFLAENGSRFEARRRAGRAVDGHGDLHLQHIWFEEDEAEPLVVDCLEFDDRLRHIDAASDVAFTAMDLRYRDAPGLADRFLRRYAAERDDFDLYAVVDCFEAYRAIVRAKVAAIAARDVAMSSDQRARAHASAVRHLSLALDCLTPAGQGALVLVGGVVGSGKSTVAEALADALGAAHGAAVIASDRVRKHRAGVAADTSLANGVDEGAYSPEERRRNYAAVLERAAPVVRSGRIAILDATWESATERTEAANLASAWNAGFWVIEARCAAPEALRRLTARRAAGGDPSDAGPDLYTESCRRFESARSHERTHWRVIETDGARWRRAIDALVADTLQALAPPGS